MVQFKNSPLTEEFWDIHSQNRKEKQFQTCGYVEDYYITDSGWFVLVINIMDSCIVEGRYSIWENQNNHLRELLEDFHCLRYDKTATLKALSDWMSVDVIFTYSETCKTHFVTAIRCNSELHCKFSDNYTSLDLQKIMLGCYHEQEEKKKRRNRV